MSEKNLWNWLKNVRSEFGPRIHINRIENSIGSGMPDVEGCIDGLQFWIELKYNAKPSKETTKIKPKFRPNQIPWMNARHNVGGYPFTLWQIGSGISAHRMLFSVYSTALLTKGNDLNTLERIALIDANKPSDIIYSLLDFGENHS